MITNRELKAALSELAGSEPPAAEEIAAWADGKLSPEDAARIERQLAAWPELARAAKVPMHYEGADERSVIERERDWRLLQGRIRESSFVSPHWRRLAIAASIATAIVGAVAVREHQRATTSAASVRVLAPEVLEGPARGTGGIPRLPEEVTLLSPTLDESQLRFDDYRIDVVDATENRVLTSVVGVQPFHHAFSVLVSRAGLDAQHEYQIVVYGVSGPQAEKLSTFGFRP